MVNAKLMCLMRAPARDLRVNAWPGRAIEWVGRHWDPVSDWFLKSGPADWVLVVVGYFAARAALRTLDSIRLQTTEIARSAKATEESATTTADTLAANKAIERAYISITHKDVKIRYARTIAGSPDPSLPVSITFTVHVRNSGRTPGNLLGGYFGYRISPEPGPPQVSQTVSPLTAAFLLPEGHVEFDMAIRHSDTPSLQNALRGRGDNRLWLIGEVDYSDRFGQMHIGGYGRRFSMASGGQGAFGFGAETGPFNFDRPMTPDEVKRDRRG